MSIDPTNIGLRSGPQLDPAARAAVCPRLYNECEEVTSRSRRVHRGHRVGTWVTALVAGCLLVAMPLTGQGAEIDQALEALRGVGPHGQGHPAAIAAARELQQLDGSHLTRVLAAMDGANPLAVNWIRGVAESLVQNSQTAQQPLPAEDLEKFLAETTHHPRARRYAYELIRGLDSTAEQRLTPTWVDDPSLELRRDAVAWLVKQADEAEKEGNTAEVERWLRQAFVASRDFDQVKEIAKRLSEAELPADTATHLGYILTWNLIGPFDNTDKAGFDVSYPPEKAIDLDQRYPGKNGQVAWQTHTTSDPYGTVNINEAVGKSMGAIVFAHSEFLSDSERNVELRLGSINANKIWLNGELLTANHVYHAGTHPDQYVGRGKLKAGKNSILVMIAQNEQTEAWAQDWNFQLRVCDAIGTAVLSQDRPASQVTQRRLKNTIERRFVPEMMVAGQSCLPPEASSGGGRAENNA